jgi:hypothetical protein
MKLRIIVLSVVLTLILKGVIFGQESQLLSLSPIQHYWNHSTQQFDLLFSVENKSNQIKEFSTILMITTPQNKDWNSTLLPSLKPHSTSMYNISFNPGEIENRAHIKIMIGLYGKNYNGFIAKSTAYLTVTEYEPVDDNKYKVNYIETWPEDIFGKPVPESKLFNVGTLKEIAAIAFYKRQNEITNKRIEQKKNEWRQKLKMPLKKEIDSISNLEIKKNLFSEMDVISILKIEKNRFSEMDMTSDLKIEKNLFPEMDVTFDLKIEKNLSSEMDVTSDLKIEKNLSSEMDVTSDLKIEKNLFPEIKDLKIISYFPGSLSQQIDPKTSIKIQFDDVLNPAKISNNNFYLASKSGGKIKKISGRTDIKDNNLDFFPSQPLSSDTEYQIVLLSSIASLGGNTMSQSYSWNFTTRSSGATLSNLPPKYLKVSSVFPGVNAKNMMVDSAIKVFFNNSLDPIAVNQQSIVLKTKGKPVKGQIEVLDKSLIFKPSSQLIYSQEYEVNLRNPVKDIDGNQLKSSARWTFKTRQKIDYPATDDPNILIFSPSHDPVTYIQEKTGILKISISAFEEILHIDINGEKINHTPASKIDFQIPFELKSTVTQFEVNTFTSVGKSKKIYTINYGYKPSAQLPYQIVGIFDLSNTDNVTSASERSSKESALKYSLTAVAQYDISFGKSSSLRSKLIILREKFADSDYGSYEVVYNQIAFEWIEKEIFSGELTAGVGWNFVSTETSGVTGENELINETFFMGKMKHDLSEKSSLTTELEYKNKNSIDEADDPDDEKDAVSITLKEKLQFPIANTDNEFKFTYNQNDAVGKYEDSTTIKYAYGISKKIANWTPSISYESDTETKTTANPSTDNKQQKDSKVTTEIGLKYQLFKNQYLTLAYSMINQTSNISSSEYDENVMALSYMFIF